MRGRAWRLVLLIASWQLIKYVVFIAAVASLDHVNELLFTKLEGQLSILVGSTVVLLLLDAAVLQILGAIFAISLAALIAYEYEQANFSQSDPKSVSPRNHRVSAPPTSLAWQSRAAVIAIAALGPLASIAYALKLSHEFVEHRPAKVTAHRAGPKDAPENSLAALRLSLEAGTTSWRSTSSRHPMAMSFYCTIVICAYDQRSSQFERSEFGRSQGITISRQK